MKTFTFSSIDKMGDFDEKYGQTYWASPNEQLEPIMFNSMNEEIGLGDTIICEAVELKESKKGTTYHRLKKVKVVSGGASENVGDGVALQLQKKSDSQLQKDIKEMKRDIKDILRIVSVGDHQDGSPDDIPFD